MNTNSLPVKLLKVKIEFDKTNPREVYKAAQSIIPNVPPYELPPEVLTKYFIPEGACPVHWARTLKKVEYTLNQPKMAKPDRRSQGTNRKYSPAKEVARMTTLAAVMGVA